MEREILIQVLHDQQEYLRGFVSACKEQHDNERPGVDFDNLISDDPSTLWPKVGRNLAHPSVPVAAIASAQIAFNHAVIALLTET